MRLSQLKNTRRKIKKIKRVGRGIGSNRGKTSGRGHKGDKSRSGYKTRAGKEGGQLPLFQKLPGRGFPNKRFQKTVFSINLKRLNEHFNEGETVSYETLLAKGFPVRRARGGIKILAVGELEKKVRIEAHAFSKNALRKLEQGSIEFKQVK